MKEEAKNATKIIKNNLILHKMISFDEVVKHGLENSDNIIKGVPWSWIINGKSITHENDRCYIIETLDGYKRFEHPDKLIAFESGLRIMTNHNTHCPGACPI